MIQSPRKLGLTAREFLFSVIPPLNNNSKNVREAIAICSAVAHAKRLDHNCSSCVRRSAVDDNKYILSILLSLQLLALATRRDHRVPLAINGSSTCVRKIASHPPSPASPTAGRLTLSSRLHAQSGVNRYDQAFPQLTLS